MVGMTGEFQLFGKERIWADSMHCFERTQFLEGEN